MSYLVRKKGKLQQKEGIEEKNQASLSTISGLSLSVSHNCMTRLGDRPLLVHTVISPHGPDKATRR